MLCRHQVSREVDGITYVPAYEETEVTKKGTLWNENGECFFLCA